MVSAKEAMSLMDMFDVEGAFRIHYNKNRDTLLEMYNKIVSSSRSSGPSTTPPSNDEFPVGCWVAIVIGIIVFLLNMCN